MLNRKAFCYVVYECHLNYFASVYLHAFAGGERGHVGVPGPHEGVRSTRECMRR